MSGGTKYDQGKLLLHLVPREYVAWAAKAFEYGTFKYAQYDWEKGFDYLSRIYDSLQRHLQAWWSREDLDPESVHRGFPLNHLMCACAQLGMLVAHVARGGMGAVDDRPPRANVLCEHCWERAAECAGMGPDDKQVKYSCYDCCGHYASNGWCVRLRDLEIGKTSWLCQPND